MFLSTTSIRPFVQNENPDNTGFKKPGASKSGGLSRRTPFKDRSVNSVSPTSKYNSKLQMQKNGEHANVKNMKCVETLKFPKKIERSDDIYLDDYASFKEVGDNFADIYPAEQFNVIDFLSKYVSGCATPIYLSDDDDEPAEIHIPNFGRKCSPIPSPVYLNDIAIPVFQFDENE